LTDYDRAKENFLLAIKFAPSDEHLRSEYKKLMEIKSAKEKVWYSKMNGFYAGSKLDEIEQKDCDE